MNVIDLLIVAVVALAVAHGLRVGAAIQVSSIAGFGGGLVLGAALAPAAAGLVDTPGAKIVVSALCVFGTASLLSGIGEVVGLRIWHALGVVHLRPLDAALGAVVGGAATLLAAWLVGVMVATVPASGLSEAIQRSRVLRFLDGALPAPPEVFARVDRLLDPLGFPQVFGGLEPRPAGPVALPSDATVRSIAARVSRSTVKILGTGCGGVKEGSGFVVAADLVVTNAHVVAGISRPVVEDRAGTHPATTVLFDPKLDIAVLMARGLAGPPLALAPTTVGRGTQGAVLGYPGGGPLRVGPAAVLRAQQAAGRDIYGRSVAVRDIYELQATVRSGHSGGPVALADGSVIGVVFARSSYTGSVGYALQSTAVRAKLVAAQRRQPASTGACTV